MDVEEILRGLVGTYSTFPNEARIANVLERTLKTYGFKVQRQYLSNNRFNLFAERGNGSKPIIFYGHMDTVPTYGNWKGNPLDLREDGDRLYGLGSCDMKGGLSAILDAVSENTDRRIKLLFSVDEENISKGAWKAVQNKGWFKDALFILSGEPGDSKHYTGGANVVTIGRRGRTVISIDIKGLASHGANAQRGINAIDEAAKIVESINKFKLAYNKRLGKESIYVRQISGESTSLSVPDTAHLELDMHLVPPSTSSEARRRVEMLIDSMREKGRLHKMTKVEIKVKARETPYIEPYLNDARNTTIRKILNTVRHTVGKPRLNYGSSVADDNIFFNAFKVPMVTIGPAGGNIHSQNEWVSRKSLGKLVKLYKALINDVH